MLLDLLLLPFTLVGWLIKGAFGLIGGLLGALGGFLGLIVSLGMGLIGLLLLAGLIGWVLGIPLLLMLGTALGLRRR